MNKQLYEGRVRHYEIGSSKFNPNDTCYFFAVAFFTDEESEYKDDSITYTKAILKGDAAKTAYAQAQKLGLIDGIGKTFGPANMDHYFKVEALKSDRWGGKERKLDTCYEWVLERDVCSAKTVDNSLENPL